MRKNDNKALISNLVPHPYSSNPEYFSKINFFYFSQDKKLAAYYWEAPKGVINLEFNNFSEIIFIQEGIIEVRKNNQTEIVTVGDCLEISANDGKLVFNVIEHTKAFGFVHPIDSTEMENINKLMHSNE